jgi:hypothetical protein
MEPPILYSVNNDSNGRQTSYTYLIGVTAYLLIYFQSKLNRGARKICGKINGTCQPKC